MIVELLESVVGGALVSDLGWAREAARLACDGHGPGLEVEVALVGKEVLVTVHGQVFGRRRNLASARYPGWWSGSNAMEYMEKGADHIQRKLARELAGRR